MSPKEHIIYGGAAAAALYPVMGMESLYFWGASFAIDLDHYLDFVFHNGLRDLSLKGMFRYHKILGGWWMRPEFLNIEVFHTVEVIGPLFILAYYTASTSLAALAAGLLFHCLLDLLFLWRKSVPFIRAHSFAEYAIRSRLMRRQGLNPESLYREAAVMTLLEKRRPE